MCDTLTGYFSFLLIMQRLINMHNLYYVLFLPQELQKQDVNAIFVK